MPRTIMPDEDLFAGVDPGKGGAVAAVNRVGDIRFEVRLSSTEDDIVSALTEMPGRIVFVLIEKVHSGLFNAKSGPPCRACGQSKSRMGAVSAFTFGESYGNIKGVMAALAMRRELITPQTWMKAIGCLTGGDKNVSKAAAQRLFPGHNIVHATADALLIAELARRIAIERGW